MKKLPDCERGTGAWFGGLLGCLLIGLPILLPIVALWEMVRVLILPKVCASFGTFCYWSLLP